MGAAWEESTSNSLRPPNHRVVTEPLLATLMLLKPTRFRPKLNIIARFLLLIFDHSQYASALSYELSLLCSCFQQASRVPAPAIAGFFVLTR